MSNPPRQSPTIHSRTPYIQPSSGLSSASQPEYAEILTPLKLRRRRPHRTVPSNAPSLNGIGIISTPLAPGPSTEGYYTINGDLFRNTTYDPTIPTTTALLDEDAVTIGGSSSTSSSSGSSNWSWGSGNLERGRRATMAVFGRVGEALGVRRGSDSSSSSGDSDRRSRILSRTISTSGSSRSPERPRRQHLPRKREFVLLLPPPDGEVGSGTGTPRDSPSLNGFVEGVGGFVSGVYPSDRVICTPSLPIVIERIRGLRTASGYTPESPSTPPTDVPLRRGGSSPGQTRSRVPVATPANGLHNPVPNRPGLRHGHTSFANPPVPQRLQVLREVKEPIRPKSVSDLIGMKEGLTVVDGLKNIAGSSVSLSSMRDGGVVKAFGLGDSDGKRRSKGCWWLDVSCPSWEDLRDLGEVSRSISH
jgi:magnesium transporter